MSDFAKVDKRLWTGAFGRHLRGNSDAQALACYLLSGPQSNTLGLYRLPKGYALADLGWTEAKFDRALEHLLDFRKPQGSDIDMTSISLRSPFLLFHEASETVWIVGHAGHTYPSGMSKGSKRSRGIENDLKRIGENAFTPLFLGRYADLLGIDPSALGYDFDITSKSYRYGSQMIPIDRDLDLERDLERDLECENAGAGAREGRPPDGGTHTLRSVTGGFVGAKEMDGEAIERDMEAMSTAYVRGKVDLHDAQRELIALRASGVDVTAEELANAFSAYEQSGAWNGKAGPTQYAPLLSRFLRERMYLHPPHVSGGGRRSKPKVSRMEDLR